MSSAAGEKDLEEQLVEVGKKLQKLPVELNELLSLLEALENCLGRVEQSPSKSMTTALCPSMKSLVSPVLLKHASKDVKLSVATCLSEITRITAPDAPYDDDLMKEIFKLIVATFEDLSDPSAPSFAKRVLILETVAKVRSCVVMLDLECDDLIVEMFHHFLKTLREDHTECVFASMEGIMTVVLEESEDIPLELLTVLLNNLKIENQAISPVARRLVEKVMANCAANLKPYLVEAVKSRGILTKEYNKIVEEIVQGAVENLEHSNLGVSSKDLPDGIKAPINNGQTEGSKKAGKLDEENVSPETVEDEEKFLKVKLSNGSLSSPKGDSSRDVRSKKRKSQHAVTGKEMSSSEMTPNNAGQRNSKTESKSNQATKKTKGCKPDTVKKATGISDDARTVQEDKDVVQPKGKKGRKKEGEPLQAEGLSAKDVRVKSESEKELFSEPSSAKSQLPDTGHSKKGCGKVAAEKGDSKTESEPPALRGEEVGTLASDSEKDTSSPLIVNKSGKEKKSKKIAEAKSLRRSSKKTQATKDNKSTPSSERQGRKFKGSSAKIEDHRKTGEKKSSAMKKPAGIALKEAETSTRGSSINGKPGCKPTPKHETDGSRDLLKACDESLVGARIKVYWPLDKAFYEGFVVSYDPVKKKHKISYVDGDEEELMLSKERWEYLEVEKQQAGHFRSGVSIDASAAITPPKKRMKTSDSANRENEVKDEPPPKKRKETPSGKSRSITPKSDAKIQSNGSSVKGKPGSAKTTQHSENKGKKMPHGSRG